MSFDKKEKQLLDQIAGSRVGSDLLENKVDEAAGSNGFEANDFATTKLVGGNKITLEDHSVNQARMRVGVGDELILECDKEGFTGSGNFVGGGSGNKPIAGIHGLGLDGHLLSTAVLIIDEDVEIRTVETAVDADQDELGISYNLLIDLLGLGDTADYKVIVITNTNSGAPDFYGKINKAASITTFDIQTDNMYVVGGLPGDVGAPSWFTDPISLATITDPGGNGGTHPVGFPNATILSCCSVSVDGGHPAGTKMAALQAQMGGSGNNLRCVTAITRLVINGNTLIG